MNDSPTPPRRFRFGLRSLFVLVTVVAMVCAAWYQVEVRRRMRFSEVARFHHDETFFQMSKERPPGMSDSEYLIWLRRYLRRVRTYQEYHAYLAKKYEWAAEHPWYPVADDLPAPPHPDASIANLTTKTN